LARARKRLDTQKAVNAAKLKKDELDVDQKDLASLDVHAEKPGIVVYQKIWKGSGPEKIRVGDDIWGGAGLTTLPDLARMQVKTFVNEADVDKLKVGRRAAIKLDA